MNAGSQNRAPGVWLAGLGLLAAGLASPARAAKEPAVPPLRAEAPGAQQGPDLDALQRERLWPELWQAAQALGPAGVRYALDARYGSGDLVGSLAAAEAVLAATPEGTLPAADLYPAYLATRVAIDLDLPERARANLAKLESQYALAASALPPSSVDWYRQAGQGFLPEIEARQAVADQARAAVRRAQITVIAALLGMLALLVSLRRR